MEPSLIFKITSNLALAGWILLLTFPKWKHTKSITTVLLSTILFGGTYTILLAGSFGQTQGNFSSLEGVQLLFQNPAALTAGWIHYLAFDLFIGTWESADAEKLGISRWLILPCQIGTFLFGPMGLLAYMILRAVLRKDLAIRNPFV
ncbi:DUF4281 domain-containing protein [Leptospira gomenensis]|uniref:DUF4281 domain-containing protein n=1 Tax=Leptospira gomenensis TaxID=2484974 RepID=A0A5F1YZV3_9LEPT|nr:ABA4-like family protein [Leptospira gomenensis]TGK36061.1 DUF4281 domain-containing protein [Leptospira gomenensis]TGK41807.1 DUF4281 domain-containing protein [Leptospira gomenensis]TGK53336.1 DUF4281 domain-containing protein [Leptospira gomenensis]TGK64942.1 DUF4281 domain-containing protein [Leptospira gomenensis]